jgi:hypothetical protein
MLLKELTGACMRTCKNVKIGNRLRIIDQDDQKLKREQTQETLNLASVRVIFSACSMTLFCI